jgi:hypothetical protein
LLGVTVYQCRQCTSGYELRLEFANINNPLSPSANYKVTVTTANTPIDGPTPSTAYTMKQIGVNALANNAVTTPINSFIKFSGQRWTIIDF